MTIFNVVPVTSADYRKRAECRLPRFLFDYADGGANDEHTMAENESDFDKLQLRQRVLRDVSNIDTSTTLMGQDAAFPVALAPVGMAGMYRRRGEVQGALAAQAEGVPFSLSTVGICPVEEIKAATGAPFWYQLYMLRDRDVVSKILERAYGAGCSTLLFTVDLPVPGLRLRDYRNGMLGGGLAAKLSYLGQLASSPAWAWDVGIKGKPHQFGNIAEHVENSDDLGSYKTFVESQFDPTCTWDDIRWLRDQWPGKLVIKGVLEADDAREAVDAGADGVVVSNHGARQLDGVASSISKLGSVAAAVGEQVEVLMDGGVRSGIDVLKALTLGARGVLIGRPWIYALSAGGQQSVQDLLNLFQREIKTGMALMGVNRIDEINADLIETSRFPG